MGEIDAPEVSSRRKFLAQAGAATGALAAATIPGSALAKKRGKRRRRKRKKYYALSAAAPFHQCAPGRAGPCAACAACQAHAANKLFATPEAAAVNRAHAGCRCGVVQAGKLKKTKWLKLFGKGRNRVLVVDRRHARVQRILAA